VGKGDAGVGGGTCEGNCVGTCSQAFDSPTCSGTLACGQNLECNNACEATAALSFTCAPPADIELESVTDVALYAAIKKHAGALAVASQTLLALRNAESFIQNRALSDFEAIPGLVGGSLVRACVLRGQTAVGNADVLINTAVNADPTRRKS
jgi:hypothetical protein